jgi:hypothetical protein
MTEAWSALDVLVTIAVFALSGLCEIGGGWLVWQAVREVRATLIPPGFEPTAERRRTASEST